MELSPPGANKLRELLYMYILMYTYIYIWRLVKSGTREIAGRNGVPPSHPRATSSRSLLGLPLRRTSTRHGGFVEAAEMLDSGILEAAQALDRDASKAVHHNQHRW